MKKMMGLFLLACLVLGSLACPGNNSPTGNGNPTATPVPSTHTATVNSTPTACTASYQATYTFATGPNCWGFDGGSQSVTSAGTPYVVTLGESVGYSTSVTSTGAWMGIVTNSSAATNTVEEVHITFPCATAPLLASGTTIIAYVQATSGGMSAQAFVDFGAGSNCAANYENQGYCSEGSCGQSGNYAYEFAANTWVPVTLITGFSGSAANVGKIGVNFLDFPANATVTLYVADVSITGPPTGPTATPTVTATWASTTVTCAQSQFVTVGSYVVESNYWNESACPGTQCMVINNSTGAFSVTQAPNCGSTVESYPNVLYGCSFGECSPSSALPIEVSSLTCITSSWNFSVGGSPSDQYDVAYDIWFCPNNSCGSSGFNGGTELMIWLDYLNTAGWQNDEGSVSIDGADWELWQATQNSGGNTWTYLAYLAKANSTSVTNLNLLNFFNDALSRSYIQSTWYLYAVQAGIELRTGGIPFNNNSFSVTVNSGC